ncbi:hypothetical protein E2C01_101753 [Portunus trituberculatus]|uniref:Transmembrane protein n=1 Tax=Portunus trituberculatus TaxID=210409 RepID=A0A5B7KKV1_PORTR|nr:hypothetical protein [Portunus trituberculatus]
MMRTHKRKPVKCGRREGEKENKVDEIWIRDVVVVVVVVIVVVVYLPSWCVSNASVVCCSVPFDPLISLTSLSPSLPPSVSSQQHV